MRRVRFPHSFRDDGIRKRVRSDPERVRAAPVCAAFDIVIVVIAATITGKTRHRCAGSMRSTRIR